MIARNLPVGATNSETLEVAITRIVLSRGWITRDDATVDVTVEGDFMPDGTSVKVEVLGKGGAAAGSGTGSFDKSVAEVSGLSVDFGGVPEDEGGVFTLKATVESLAVEAECDRELLENAIEVRIVKGPKASEIRHDEEELGDEAPVCGAYQEIIYEIIDPTKLAGRADLMVYANDGSTELFGQGEVPAAPGEHSVLWDGRINRGGRIGEYATADDGPFKTKVRVAPEGRFDDATDVVAEKEEKEVPKEWLFSM